jgi:hypothetical protein
MEALDSNKWLNGRIGYDLSRILEEGIDAANASRDQACDPARVPVHSHPA